MFVSGTPPNSEFSSKQKGGDKLSEKFICSYCGAEYDTPAARARCELECDEKMAQERERQRRRDLEKARNDRFNEIKEVATKLEELVKAYQADYKTEILFDKWPDSRWIWHLMGW